MIIISKINNNIVAANAHSESQQRFRQTPKLKKPYEWLSRD